MVMKTIVLLLLVSAAVGSLLENGDGAPPKDCK